MHYCERVEQIALTVRSQQIELSWYAVELSTYKIERLKYFICKYNNTPERYHKQIVHKF